MQIPYNWFNTGDKECSNRDSWLSNFDLHIKKLLSNHHDARVETGPGLLALAYVVSILERINPALRRFKDYEKTED